jgi:macrolide transport system ATP-binding/permease protein
MGDSVVAALDGVQLDVHQGDFLMVVGSSGSGKSTLMHLLGLLDVASDGVMEINGRSMLNGDDAQLSACAMSTSALSSSNSICCRTSTWLRTSPCR